MRDARCEQCHKMPGALNQFRFQIMVRGRAGMHSRNLCIHTMFSMYTYTGGAVRPKTFFVCLSSAHTVVLSSISTTRGIL